MEKMESTDDGDKNGKNGQNGKNEKKGKKNKKKQLVYIMAEGYSDNYKIGISANPEKRRRELQTGCSKEIRILFTCKIDDNIVSRDVETVIHKFLKEKGKWIRGEWFRLTKDQVVNIAKCLLKVGENAKNSQSRGSLM